MTDDLRCCGSGVCIIDSEGRCWCGRQWDRRATAETPVEDEAPDKAEQVMRISVN